ncbi:MAG: ribonuclease HII [Candidatus Absconditabacterales bacterium]
MKIYIDEVGRGPLAGPLYVGLILTLQNIKKNKLFQDSKKLTEKKRELAFTAIQKLEDDSKILYSTGITNNKEIDKYGVTKSINLAITRGIFNLLKKLNEIYPKSNTKDIFKQNKITYLELKKLIQIFSKYFKHFPQLIIDGNHDFNLKKDLGINTKTIIKGDEKIIQISMASIVAKVCRDNFMQKIHKKYPKYLFNKHKGYGSLLHRNLIKKNGICLQHRKLFLKTQFPEHKIKKYNLKYVFVNNKLNI